MEARIASVTRIPYAQLQGDVADADLVIPGKRKPDPDAEWRLHAACAKLCFRLERANPDFRFFSPGSEGARHPVRAGICRAMGQNRKGVPDMWMMRKFYTPGFRMCIVEFKRPGGKLTPEQCDWLEWLSCETHVCTSVEQFRAILAAFVG